MDFGWDADQRATHQRMRDLGARAQAAAPERRLAILAEGGALGLPLSREVGGAGLDLVTTAYAYEGLGRTLADGGALLAAGAHLFGVALTIARVGTETQKRAWLPKLASGEAIATVAVTEAASGSDIASVEAFVETTATGFRFSGAKRFVTSADRAAVYFVLGRAGARAAGEAESATPRGLTALLVPRDARGVRTGPRLETRGLRTAAIAPVDFDACDVGADALLGREGAGLAVFQIAMTFERALILAFRLGAMETALEEAVRFVRSRTVGSTPIAHHQAVSHRIANMKRGLETSRLLVYRAAWALDRGERGQAEAALAKWHVADTAIGSALDAFHLRGGAGYLEGAGLLTTLDDALGGGVHSGTQDVLASIVARWLGV